MIRPGLRAPAFALAGVSLIALLALPAAAQTAPAAKPTPATADTAPAEQPEVVITGTRIRNADFETANPVVSVNAARIQETGDINLTQYLQRLPALIGSFGPTQAAGGSGVLGIGETGLNELNLRNLGTSRTLVLIDGRRQVGGEPGVASVDINTIPTDLVERVDVLTGGASAIYGADGVTGVVNFILKKDFQGLTVRAQNGISTYGDGAQRLFSATAGKNFGGGRGNIAVSFEYGRNERLAAADRSYLVGPNAPTFQINPNSTGPSRVPLTDIRYYDSSRQGGIDLDFDGLPDYTGTGQPWNHGTFVPDFYQQGGSGTLTTDYRGDILPQVTRYIGNLITHYDFSDKFTLYAEAKYAHTISYSVDQPTFDYYIMIQPDNPYIPDSLKSAVADGGGALLNRDNFDLGVRGERIIRNTVRGVIGAKGDLSSHLRYDASYTYSQNKITNHFIGDQYTDRFFAAIDAVSDGHGGVTCRINLDPTALPDQPYSSRSLPDAPLSFSPGSCVPLNLFGEGSPSQGAKDFISVNTTDHSKLTQQVATAALSGDTGAFFNLPGGPLGFALGAEWRRETSKDVPDIVAQQGLTFTNVTPISKGHFDVKEVFGEFDAPLLRDLPFARLLDLGGAVRFSDYSTVGRTTTWQLNGKYSPVRDITFRGTYAQAVRAPNIGELFAPNGQDFEFINDPCAAANVNLGKSSRQANCQALLSGLGVADPASFGDLNSANIPGLLGGNSTLTEETARTWTVGAVFQPHWIRGLTLSADWYDIRLKNAISYATAQQLADLCVDQPTLDNQFCTQIQRNNGGSQPGRIVGFTRYPQNVASYATSGLDVDVDYRLKPNWDYGSFDFHLVGNYLNKLQLIGIPGADPTDYRGTQELPAPKYQFNLDVAWTIHKLTLAYNLNWFSHTLRYSHDTVNADPEHTAPEYKYIKARAQHDIYASYDVTEKFQIFGGINDFTNPKPGFAALNYPDDPLGRFFFVGAKVKLAKLF